MMWPFDSVITLNLTVHRILYYTLGRNNEIEVNVRIAVNEHQLVWRVIMKMTVVKEISDKLKVS
jgi:hypothetical protein